MAKKSKITKVFAIKRQTRTKEMLLLLQLETGRVRTPDMGQHGGISGKLTLRYLVILQYHATA